MLIGYKKVGKRLRKYLLIILGILIATYHIYDYRSRHHYYEFDLGDKYAIEIELIEYDSFLDYPVDLEFEVENRKNHDSFHFEVSSGEGPYFQFLTSENQPDVMLIRGVGNNQGSGYWIDLVNKTVEQNYQGSKDDNTFKVVAEFTYDLKLVER
ncbi:MAG: hypothetical protein HEP71_05930 [Roseivirga sp.]|nr:hypothetical protein [Roseivirga sp.]